MKFCFLASGLAITLGSILVDPPKPLKKGPLAYFDGHCARCHGPYGSNYSATFGKDLPLPKMRKEVNDMATGPGGESLLGQDLDAQVAFHQALAAKIPFVDWTAQKGRTLSGEVTPKAKVELQLGDQFIPATVDDDGNWRADLPIGKTSVDGVNLRAMTEKSVATAVLSERPYSLPPKPSKQTQLR